MLKKEEIINILSDWNIWQRDMEIGVLRADYLKKINRLLASNQILAIMGPRRAGKSYIMRQLMNQLAKSGVNKKQLLFINFEDPRLGKLDAAGIQFIYETYLEFIRPLGKIFLFLDEVQEADGWEKWVRVMHELGKATIIISGSNSKLLGKEMSVSLSGRHIDITVFPLSFKEFLFFKGFSLDDNFFAGDPKSNVLLREYLEWGGLPEVVKSADGKKEILLNYFSDIVSNDLARRYRVRKVEKLAALARFYCGNMAAPSSFNAASRWLGVSPDTAEKFAGYFTNAYLLYFLKRFSFKIKEQEKSPRKVYAIDFGLAGAVGFSGSDNWGKKMENMVFVELLRRSLDIPLKQIYYWKDAAHHEADFIITQNGRAVEVIQAAWDVADEKTRAREKRGLLKAMKDLRLKEGKIITLDYDAKEMVGENAINYISFINWLC